MNTQDKTKFLLQCLALLKPHAGRMAVGLSALLIAIAFELSYPKAIGYFIDNSVALSDANWIVVMALIMVLAIAIHAAAIMVRYYIFISTGSIIVANLRQTLFSAIIRQKIPFFDANNVGALTNRLSSDTEKLQDVLTMGLAIFLRVSITIIGGSVLLLLLSPELSLLLLIIIPPTLFITKRIGEKISKKTENQQEELAKCGDIAQEAFSNIRLVHAFTKEKKEEDKYQEATTRALSFSLANARLFAGFQGAMRFVLSFVLLVTLWTGGILVSEQKLTIGGLMSFILYAGMVGNSITTFSSIWNDWMQSMGGTRRIFEIIDDLQSKNIGKENITEKKLEGNIEFDSVEFSYPSRPNQKALRSFNLKIKSGEKIALIGPSGAGKTTIVNLILGFYSPTAGQLKFDGYPVSLLGIANVRRHIAVVEQEPTLFSGSIRDNICYASFDGDDVTDEKIIEMAKHANAHDFICSFPDGYDTLVGNRGQQLSGGQKQRIAIARALLSDPKILLLDEATSSLDSESETQVQEGLRRLMEGRTTIIIAHKFSTIAHADRLVVLKDGAVVQNDTHENLIKDLDGLYCQLLTNQRAQFQRPSNQTLIHEAS